MGGRVLLRSYQLLVISQTTRFLSLGSPIQRKPTILLETSCLALSPLQRFRELIGLTRGFSTKKTTGTMPGITEEKFSRLPTYAVPTHYNIRLSPNLTSFEVDGQETVTLQMKEASKKLKFYASGLTITSAKVKLGSEVLEGKTEYSEKWETAEVSVEKEIPAGSEAELSLSFTGKLIQDMKGFYRSQYKDAHGKEHFLATTQFESTYARRAFPCWDEPVYKATFDITLVVPKDKTALSNMNVVKEEEAGKGLKSVVYATTPKMSTYLVAFIVGDFKYTETKTKSGVVVRLYALPGKEDQGSFALECGKKAIDYYDDFFGIQYPLPKCDLIAIPDFAMGAMENWGLVTYREICLLVDEAHSSAKQKARVALVVGHELAHMWFGNLATMEWWTDLWLKEGFATFMEYLFVGEAYPEFQIWQLFVNDEIASAMSLDGLKNSHPIEVEIGNPNEIEEIYDGVSYAKSASIIRMLYHHLGAKTFQTAAAHYMNEFKYRNAVTKDLWKALTDASQVDVASLMKEWTGFMGYPVVSVSSRQEGTSRVLSLSQKRFLSDGSEDEKAPVWKIPISVLTGSDPSNIKEKFLMDKKTMEHTLPNVNDTEFVKLNAHLSGFFRVEYSGDMLSRLVEGVSQKKLNTVDRFSLVLDLFALTRAGRVPATQFLSVVEACSEEDQYTVWSELDTGVGSLANVLSRNEEVMKSYNKLIQKVYKGIADKLGWDKKQGEDHQTGLLRALVLGRLGKAGHEENVARAKKVFDAHVNDGQEIPPDLRGMIFAVNARWGGEEAQNKLKKVFETSEFSEVQANVLMSMTYTPDAKLQKLALEYGMTDAVRKQDKYMLFFGCGGTPSGQDTVWDYYRDNMDNIVSQYNGANDNIFQAITKEFFARSKHAEVLSRPVKQSVENVRLNANLLKRNEASVAQWLKDKGY